MCIGDSSFRLPIMDGVLPPALYDNSDDFNHDVSVVWHLLVNVHHHRLF
jgi:hypothetical protein